MKKPKLLPQWRKRLNIVEAIFSDLIFAYDQKQYYERVIKPDNWSDFEKLTLFYYLEHKGELQKAISSLLREDWTLDRICKTTLAILLEAIAEYQTFQTPIKVLIHQAIVSCQRISEYKDYKFVNYILDRYFKSL